jgi:hypothetical protein
MGAADWKQGLQTGASNEKRAPWRSAFFKFHILD